jgi:hypothetical protein
LKKKQISQSQNEPAEAVAAIARQPEVIAYSPKLALISLFIVFNILGIGLSLCAPSKFRDALVLPFNYYLWYTGLWQNFCVFVPNPKTYNIHLTAIVSFNDGSTAEWQFPRMETLDPFTRMLKERYRKWANDNVNSNSYKVWWPDTGRYIARQYKDAPHAPILVTLVRHWTPIPAPGTSSEPQTEKTVAYYTYTVKREDLE